MTPAFSQTTTINLGTQGRNPDFSSFPFTRPITVGTTLPATCQVGQLFFNSAAAAGANLYGCTAVNAWTALTGTGGGSGSSGTSSSGGTSTGNGIGQLNVTSLNFGTQVTGTTSTAQPVILSNSGTGTLTVSGVTVSGANASDFAQTNNCSSVSVGTTCTVAVTFAPSTTASETATLTITDNGTGSPHTVSLSGTGTTAAAGNGPAITPSALATSVGKTLTLTANKSVTWSLAPGSAGSITGNGTSAVYTPPATISAQNTLGGCMVLPNDSVFNTRIDNLPVHSQSATWMSSFISPIVFLVSWGANIIDNTVPSTPVFFHYTTAYNGSFQLATWPNRKRETGAFTVDPGNDHHMLSVNRQTCQFVETYQDGIPVSGCPACNAASGYQYASTSYTQPANGTTDAAGLPLAPLTLHLSEIKAGAIKHALRFTLCTGCINAQALLWPATGANGSISPNAPPMGARFRLKQSFVVSGIYGVSLSSGGSGYTSSPKVTISGCQTAPSATAMISGGTISSIVINSMGSGCSNPTVTIGGPGTGASASAWAFSPTAQVLLTGLQQYGMILADNGTAGEIEADTDIIQDPVAASALNEIGNAKLGASYFEVVDESSLMVSKNSHEVNPNNGYVTPSTYAVVTATDSQGNKTTAPIAIQPVTVGVLYPKLIILAGMSGYQLQSWVNGSTNQTVNWSLTSGPGSVTAGGLYTPPATISAPTDAILTATSAADSNATAVVIMTVIPPGANPANSIRIDVGSSSPYTDSQGNTWMPDVLGWESGAYSVQFDSYPVNAWGTAVDQNLYKTYIYTWGDDIFYGPFVVPNGNYKLGFAMGMAGCSGTYSETSTFDNGLVWGPVDLESQGQIGSHFDLGKAVNYQCRTPYMAYIPAQVTNNVLYAVVRSTGGNQSHAATSIAGLSIVPDTTAPYLSIDSGYTSSVSSGAVVQLYAVGWYMSNSVTWSVSGPGSIDQTGLYSAPASVASTTTTTITATSTTNPSISATFTLTLNP
ncbi:MAG: choice-of-anchor D domain-containing protein [Acidobacteriaceae bacterium]|nr:choice-of-anchor D domain-containing protein [Acidobacteriaceae bacterium]